jgi:hypothetical protein
MKKLYLKFIITLIIVFLVLSGFVVFLKNPKAETLAQSEIICDKKIPIGEAMDETIELLDPIFQELQRIHQTIPNQITAAREMLNVLGNIATDTETGEVKLPENCDISNCMPVCINTPLRIDLKYWCFFTITYPACVPICYPGPCLGRICPDLNLGYSMVQDSYNEIIESQERIKKLITEEIISGNALTEFFRKIGQVLKITGLRKSREIELFLNKARTEFSNCPIPQADWPKIERGEISPREAIRVKEVIENEYALPEKTLQDCQKECQEECHNKPTSEKCQACIFNCVYGSILNWFCCH